MEASARRAESTALASQDRTPKKQPGCVAATLGTRSPHTGSQHHRWKKAATAYMSYHCQEAQAMKQTAIRLPEDTYNRLQALAARTGRDATFYIREAIEQHLEDLEDLYTAEKAAVEHRKGAERTLSLDELDSYLGLES